MDGSLSLGFAAIVGLGHAFETDHLLALSSLVSKTRSHKEIAKTGFVWGLGHTSTIVLIGILLIGFKVTALNQYFDSFELFVGIMLVFLGSLRIYQLFRSSPKQHQHKEGTGSPSAQAFSIGLVHGLAGSGAIILLVLADINNGLEAFSYLCLFGIGSAIGMAIAGTAMRLIMLSGGKSTGGRLRFLRAFVWLSAMLCIGYGVSIILRFL